MSKNKTVDNLNKSSIDNNSMIPDQNTDSAIKV